MAISSCFVLGHFKSGRQLFSQYLVQCDRQFVVALPVAWKTAMAMATATPTMPNFA